MIKRKFFILVKPKSKKEQVKKIEENHYIVSVKEPPVKGKANKAIIKALANFFDVSQSKIHIIHGEKSKQKIIEIL